MTIYCQDRMFWGLIRREREVPVETEALLFRDYVGLFRGVLKNNLYYDTDTVMYVDTPDKLIISGSYMDPALFRYDRNGWRHEELGSMTVTLGEDEINKADVRGATLSEILTGRERRYSWRSSSKER